MVEVEANFVYTSKEDMNIAILEDFNRVSLNLRTLNISSRELDSNEYLSPRKSQWLSKDSLRSYPGYSAEFRNPLVFYKGQEAGLASSLQPSNSFELTFGADTYKETFVRSKFGDNYFFKTDNFFKSNLDK